MTILFAHSFFMNFDEKQSIIHEPYPPLGTIIAAACARNAGFKISLFDAMLAPDIRAFPKLLSSEVIETVVFFEDHFNWVSKMCQLKMREACVEMIGHARDVGARVVVAGPDASNYPEVYLKAGALYVIKGEAESRLISLLNHLAVSPSLPFEAPGVFYLENNEIRGSHSNRENLHDTLLPAPAWDLVNMSAYRDTWRKQHDYFTLSMVTTLGCPYRCNWCIRPVFGAGYHVRSPREIALEMRDLKKRHKPDRIWFVDEVFGLQQGWIEEFAREIQELNASVPFKIQARADLIDASIAKALSDAGCREVWMGVESGSQKILDAMDKDLKVAQIHDASAHLKAHGIHPCLNLLVGYPGETVEDIRATWDLVEETKPHNIRISVAYPVPGTPFHDRVENQMLDVDHWHQSRHLMPVFQTTYPTDFYPLLYQYFHLLFRHMSKRPGWGLRRLRESVRRAAVRRRFAAFGVKGVPFI